MGMAKGSPGWSSGEDEDEDEDVVPEVNCGAGAKFTKAPAQIPNGLFDKSDSQGLPVYIYISEDVGIDSDTRYKCSSMH
uniref:GG13103 n=1 Tax=Drosophila erecta TaxID=7220 RepID=B3NYJ3_DROER